MKNMFVYIYTRVPRHMHIYFLCMYAWMDGWMHVCMLGQDGIGWETFFQDLLGLPMLVA